MHDRSLGPKITTAAQLKSAIFSGKNRVFVGGNLTVINEYFEDILSRKNLVAAFIGDNQLEDVHATYEFD